MAWKRATSGLVVYATRFFWGGPQFESRRTRLFFNQLDRAILAAHVLEVLGVALCRLPGPIHPRAFRDSFACIRCCLPRCKGYGSTGVVRKAQRGRNKVYGGRE